jgi:hypothetical protein
MDMNKRKSAIKYTSRSQLIDRIRRELEHRGYPRLQMLLLVSLTGGAGFLASYALLHAGLETLSWRYGLAVVIAYVFFLLLLWLWLRTDAADYDGLDESWMDIADAVRPRGGNTQYQGGGGKFGGSGSSAQWDDASSEPLVELPELPDLPDVGDLPDADELAIPLGILLAVVTIVVTVLVASVSIVYSAPVLFAELLVDGVLAATLYRRLRRLDSRHWLQSAVRRTFVPFAITALLMMAAGWGLSSYAPTARSLGEVLATR